SSLIVGRSVKVKIVASMADQNSSSMNAIHGTPGWRELESSIAKGDVTRFFRVRHNSPTPRRSRPQIQPTNTRRKRARPNQKNHAMRTASHQDMSSAARKRPRPARNEMVEGETIVLHTPATTTLAGQKR